LQIIKLKKNKEKSILRRHPWIFSGAIADLYTALEDGEIVEIFTAENKYIATAYFQKNASIAFKIISFEKKIIDENFWKNKIIQAFDLRKRLNLIRPDNNIFRLINGESDGFPGLIVDHYAGVLVVQAYSAGMNKLKPLFNKIFQEIFKANQCKRNKDSISRDKGQKSYSISANSVDRKF
jgi:23S rRNA (cytosine1962-C5)-methyltransferase